MTCGQCRLRCMVTAIKLGVLIVFMVQTCKEKYLKKILHEKNFRQEPSFASVLSVHTL